jgi:hypothetical protein
MHDLESLFMVASNQLVAEEQHAMFIKLTKDVSCTSSYLYDREPFNKWSNAPDIRRTAGRRDLKVGEIIEVVWAKPAHGKADQCEIYIGGESDEFITGIEWNAIEIYRDSPGSDSVKKTGA